MVKIKYNGPIGNHYVTSPLRRVSTYGLHTRGDIFEVDEKDQKARPEVFVLYQEPAMAAPRDEAETILVQPEVNEPDQPLVEAEPELPIQGVAVEKVVTPKKKPVKRNSKK